VQIACSSVGVPPAPSLRRWARLALDGSAAITLRVVGGAEGRRLNRNFRGRDYATNVLSFDYGEPGRRGVPSGDIVLCHSVIAREAREQGKPLPAHYAHMVVHGVLHLRGMDHVRAAARQRMEQREIALLETVGLANPYRTPGAVESARDRIRK